MREPVDFTPVRRVAGFGLTTEPIDVSGDGGDAFLPAVQAQRLTGLAAAAWRADRLGLSDPDALLATHREVMLTALELERRLLRLAALLDRSGIEFLVLKGPAVAHTIYPDPAWRPFGDIDILVRTKDWSRTCQLLEGLGYRRLVPEPRPGFDTRFGKGAEYRGPQGLEIDLHRTLVLGPFGLWLDLDDLFAHADTFSLGGRLLPRLDDTGMLLHACLHAVLGPQPPLLLPLRDVVQSLGSADIRWPVLRDWSVRWNVGPVLAEAFSVVERTFGFVVPAEARLAAAGPGSRRARSALRASVATRGGGPAVATMRAIPGIRAKASYMWDLLVPARPFLASTAFEGRRPSYLRRWIKPIGWLRGGGDHS